MYPLRRYWSLKWRSTRGATKCNFSVNSELLRKTVSAEFPARGYRIPTASKSAACDAIARVINIDVLRNVKDSTAERSDQTVIYYSIWSLRLS